MSDENPGINNIIEPEEDQTVDRRKRKWVITDRVARILAFSAVGILAIVLSVTISFLTYRFMDRGSRVRQFPVLSDEYSAAVPEYAIWNFLTDEGYDLRTQTADTEGYTISARIKLGFDDDSYRDLASELTSKNDAIIDTVRFYFSQRSREQLQDETAVKAELMSRINSLLARGQIEQVWFLQYQIIGL